MFVAELDWPWSETPFHFQGFEILSDSEIELLGRHCKTVYVDSSFTSSTVIARNASAIRMIKSGELGGASAATQAVDAQRLNLLAQLTGKAPHAYEPTSKLKREAKKAIAAFEHARSANEKLHRAIRKNRGVEAKHCRGVIEPIVQSVIRNPDAMVWLTFLYKSDAQPNDRQISNAVWCAIFGRYLGLQPAMLLDFASGALLLDIGLMKIAASLKSAQGEYAKRQKLAMQSHVRIGLEILEHMPGISNRVREMLAQHHERVDGSGYPLGLKRESISAYGAIAAVIDSYDAMITEGPYRAAISSADAIRELKRLADTHFVRSVVEQFVQALGMFPSGSIVELNTGEVAIVAEQDPAHRLRPRLLVVRSQDKEPVASPKVVNLASFSP